VQPTPTQAPVSAPDFAPHFARQLGVILTALAAIVARRFLRDRSLAPLIVPLWNRLNRYARRFQSLMANVAAGKLPKPRRPRPHAETTRARPAQVLPTGRGWLIRVLGYEAANCATQLEALLAEPGAAALLARAPTAGRILNPISRMLAIGAFAPNRLRPPRPAKPPPPPPLRLGEIVARGPGIIMRLVHTPPLNTG
jgi:hypothetical protein